MSLYVTRSIVDAIHSGQLVNAKTEPDPIFGFDVVQECPNVPAEILRPCDTWSDQNDYEQTARRLAGLFQKNFQKYADIAGEDVAAAGPRA